jgi:hypothetical protein
VAPGYATPVPQSANGLAIAALVMGIAGLATCGIAGILGLVFGYIARRQIREGNGSGDGMALAGIILGWVWLALFIVMIVVYVALFAVGAYVSNSYTDSPGSVGTPT